MNAQKNIDQLNDLLCEELHGHKVGTTAYRLAVGHALNKAFAAGLIASPPEWEGNHKVTCELPGEIKTVEITGTLWFGDDESDIKP